jgi:histidinol phosphatase-like PHP family hydrolase
LLSTKLLGVKEKSDITVELGIEIGFSQKAHKIKKFIRTYLFDLVIISIHVINGWILDDSFERHEFSKLDNLWAYK